MWQRLAIVGEEGLAPMWQRHLAAHQLLWQGLGEIGLEPYVADPKDR
jgi:alanine-glyoxylate transaminase/serine-glyoxylate transaminase/serine-pyruvate transaminase